MSANIPLSPQAVRHILFAVWFHLALVRAKIWSLDLGYVRAKLISPRNEGMSAESADQAVEAYRRYLFMAYMAGFPIVPTREADLAWHHHILHTQQYMHDCAELFGRYLHHRPAAENAPIEDRARMRTSFKRTAELYEELFGEVYAIEEVVTNINMCDSGGCNACRGCGACRSCGITPLAKVASECEDCSN